MMWCGQEDALKSVHLRHAEKCALHMLQVESYSSWEWYAGAA